MKTPCKSLSELCLPTALQKHHKLSMPSVLKHFSVLGDCNIDFTWNSSCLATELQCEHSRTKLDACVALLYLAKRQSGTKVHTPLTLFGSKRLFENECLCYLWLQSPREVCMCVYICVLVCFCIFWPHLSSYSLPFASGTVNEDLG